jgi:two-component system nitrogen regulation response regulator GlnG
VPTLLVVDDEPSILHFFRRAFGDQEVDLVTASSAADGLEKAQNSKPDLIVLDVDLAGQSGLDLFARFRRSTRALRSSSLLATAPRQRRLRRCS